MEEEFKLGWNTRRIHDIREKVRAVFIENGTKEKYRIVMDADGFLYIDKGLGEKKYKLTEVII